MKGSCDTCQYWVADARATALRDPRVGECRRFPPRWNPVGPSNVFTPTLGTTSCGEYREVEA